jgi:hypothetical protein
MFSFQCRLYLDKHPSLLSVTYTFVTNYLQILDTTWQDFCFHFSYCNTCVFVWNSLFFADLLWLCPYQFSCLQCLLVQSRGIFTLCHHIVSSKAESLHSPTFCISQTFFMTPGYKDDNSWQQVISALRRFITGKMILLLDNHNTNVITFFIHSVWKSYLLIAPSSSLSHKTHSPLYLKPSCRTRVPS